MMAPKYNRYVLLQGALEFALGVFDKPIDKVEVDGERIRVTAGSDYVRLSYTLSGRRDRRKGSRSLAAEPFAFCSDRKMHLRRRTPSCARSTPLKRPRLATAHLQTPVPFAGSLRRRKSVRGNSRCAARGTKASGAGGFCMRRKGRVGRRRPTPNSISRSFSGATLRCKGFCADARGLGGLGFLRRLAADEAAWLSLP